MVRRTSPVLERLEERALLSSLAFSLTTDQSNYQVGQPIKLTFTEKNTGQHSVTVEVSPTDFTISQNSATIWQSDPSNENQPPKSKTLLPGQTISQTADWDGTWNDPGTSPFGSLQSSAVNVFVAFVVSNPNAPQGLDPTFQITDPMSYSLTTDQSVYHLGSSIQLTYASVNTSDEPITLPVNEPAGFSIAHNGTAVLIDALPAIFYFGTQTIQPGQTFTDTQTWNGIPMFGPYTIGNLTGTFVVSYGPGGGPTPLTTSFQIAAPSSDALQTSVTTDRVDYDAGQPVNLTFTEKNNGDQPVAVITGSPEFEVTQNETTIWGPFYAGAPITMPPTWSTLQPGRSYSQTATWNGIPTTGPFNSLAAPFTASDEFDPNADTATFQYVAPPTGVLSTSLTTDQSVYQLGKPIQLTFTETNVGTTPVQVQEGPSSFDVRQNGNAVWNSLYPDSFPDEWVPQSYSWVTLQPGQSFTQTAAWNGIPDQLPSADSSGTFTISNALDPRGETATIQIVAPAISSLTTTITTNKPVYDFDVPARFTFTETNTGNQPIAVLTGPTAFEMTSNGTEVWESTATDALPSAASWETLQAGQSYTQAITWDGFDGYSNTSAKGAGTFAVSDLLDPTESFASFQILSTPFPTQPNPQEPPSPVVATLSTVQATYKVGQTVRVSLTLKDISASKVAVRQSQHIDKLTVLRGSTVVYESARRFRAFASKTIKPGHALKTTTVWSGEANQLGVKKLTPGIYTIEVDDDGYVASTTVNIVSRRK